MGIFLEAEAQLNGEFLHPGGLRATQYSLTLLDFRPGDRLLELGCGTGTTTAMLARGGAHVVALDKLPAMLGRTGQRLRQLDLTDAVQLLHADVHQPLPLTDCSFDSAISESVIALMDPEPSLRECLRVLRPGGTLLLNERIWKSGISQSVVDETNALSRAAFGIPAATPAPLDRQDWVDLLGSLGFTDVTATPVDSLLHSEPYAVSTHGNRARRLRYLRHPTLIWSRFRFRQAMRQHDQRWRNLESYLFFAYKPVSE